jgi:uncharacterized repeat protein (TIGR01451 family)
MKTPLNLHQTLKVSWFHCLGRRRPSGSGTTIKLSPRSGGLAVWLRFCWLLLAAWGTGAQAQLIINSISPAAVTNTPGTSTTFTLNYTWPNLTMAATGAVITITVPSPVQNSSAANVTLVNNAQITNSYYATSNQMITFQFVNPLPAGSAGTLQFSAYLRTDGTVSNGTSATFVATTSAAGQPPYTNTARLAASGVSDNASLTQSILGAGTATTNSIITYQLSPRNANPSLNITNWSMVDTLPTNVAYLSSSPAGVYNASAGTVTWTSNSTPFNVQYAPSFTVQVVAPATAFSVGNVLTNRAMTTNIFLDGSLVIKSVTNTVTLTAPGISFDSISKASNSWNGQFSAPFNWTISARARGNDVANTFTITDTLPAAFVPTAINPGFGDVNPTTVYIQYQTKNNPSWILLPGTPFVTTNAANATNQIYYLTNLALVSDVVTMVQWTYTNVTPLFTFQNNTDIKPTVTGIITNIDRNGATVSPTALVTNYASLGATHGTNLNLGTISNYVTLAVAAPLVSLSMTVSAGNNAQPGQTNTWTLTLNNTATASDNLTNPVVADLLPLSLQYVPGSSGGSATHLTLTNTIATINYNGTGRTLLELQYSGYLPPNSTVSPTFKTCVNAGVASGIITNWISLIGWANPNLNSSSAWVNDTNNLSGTGNTNLTFPTVGGNLTVTVAAAVSALQLVKGQLDSTYVGSPSNGSTYPSGPFTYQETLANHGNVALTNITVVDILPYVGDVGVMVTNQARNSAWQPFLTGPVSGPSGVTVYYSQSTNPYRPQIIASGPPGSVNDWSTTPPADITTVRALEFVFGPTNVLNPLDAVQLSWSMQTPANAAAGSVANNSFAYTATPELASPTPLISEPAMVGVQALAKQPAFLGDYIWTDANGNGIQDAGEIGLNNVRVELYQAGPSGIPGGSDEVFLQFALTANGPTGSPGYYQFTYLPAGNYFVKVIPPADYAISPEYQGSNSNLCSAFNPASGYSALITLALGDTNENVDCGLYYTDTGTVGNYVWIDRNGNGLQDEGGIDGLNGVTVQIYSVTATTNLYATTTTSFDNFGNPGYYYFYNLPPGQYQLRFVPPAGDTFTSYEAAGHPNSGNESEANANGWTSVFTVNAGDTQTSWNAGIILPSGPLSVGNMVWYDPQATSRYNFFSGERGINNVIVSLYWDTDGNGVFTPGTDQLFSSTLTSTLAGEPGNYSFNNLPAGNFIVVLEAINFQPGGALYGLTNDPIWLPATNSLDSASKGSRAGAYIASTTFPLAAGTEPTAPNSNQTLDFGLTSPTNLVSVGNTVFLDSNRNGMQDNGEPGIAGMAVQLWRLGTSSVVGGTDAVLVASTTTDTNGNYSFIGVPPTNYFLELPTPPTNAEAISPVSYAANQFAGYNHGVQPNGCNTAVFSPSLNLTNNDLTEGFGFFDSSGLIAIGNVIFRDANVNGKQDAGEPGIAGVGVALAQIGSGVSNVVAYAITDTNGMYLFDLQPPGTYSVVVLATNFQTGGPLANFLSCPGMVPTNQYSSLASDQYDHGNDDATPALDGTYSPAYYFAAGAAPAGQTPTSPTEAPLANANLTIDFGFYQPVQAPLTFTPASPQVCNTTNLLWVTGGSGTGVVSFAVLSGPGVIVNSNQLWVTNGTGLIQLIATKGADSLYYSSSVTGLVTAAKASQTINFAAIANTASTNTVSLSASASSGLPASFALVSGPAVLNGSQLTFSGTGQVSVAASQAGNSNFGPATAVTNTFMVQATAQAPLVFAPAPTQVYNTTNLLGVTGGSGAGLVSFAVLSGPGVIVNGNQLWVTSGTGTIQVQATKAADALYSVSTATASVTAMPANVAIVLGNLNATYDGTAKVVSVSTTPSGVAATETYNGLSSAPTNAGSYTVIATSADPNYTGAATNTLTIATAPTTLVLSSSENPSRCKDSVSFTATIVSNATGSVIFSTNGVPFSTNALSSGSAISLATAQLPVGTNLITAAYSGDSDYSAASSTSLPQVVTNLLSVQAVSYTRSGPALLRITISQLLTNTVGAVVTNLSLTSVSVSTNGVTVQQYHGYLIYQTTNTVADQFTYGVSDGAGDTATGTVNIVPALLVAGQTLTINVNGGTVSLNCTGVPGVAYTIQRSTDLVGWTDLYSTNAPANGVVGFEDVGAPQSPVYYRVKLNY